MWPIVPVVEEVQPLQGENQIRVTIKQINKIQANFGGFLVS